MQRVFLSHSSKDKDSYVRIVANKLIEKLGEDSIVLDELTFQEGRRIIDEIKESLKTTDLFVIFISDNSLTSDWVQNELEEAYNLWQNKNVKQICPIIIDSKIKYDDSRIPIWMKDYNLQFIRAPKKAAQVIQQRMFELSFEMHPRLEERKKIFVGRNRQIADFEERVDDFEKRKPVFIVATGIPSIGRRALLKHCIIKSNIKRLSYPFASITLAYNESIEDFIIKLNGLNITSGADIKSLLTRNIDEKVGIAIDIIQEIQQQNDVIFIEDNGAMIDYSGELVPWVRLLVLSKKIRDKVTFCIASRFRLRTFGEKVRYDIRQRIFYFQVEELSKKERSGLLMRYLKFENVTIDSIEDQRMILNLLAGFPEQIFYTVTMVKDKGIGFVKNNTNMIVEFNTRRASIIIKEIEEDSRKIGFLALISRFDYVSIEYIKEIVNGEERYLQYLEEFLSKSICNNEGLAKEYIRVNDVIKDYVTRNKYKIEDKHERNIEKMVKKFLSEDIDKSEYDASEYLFSLKEALLKGMDIKKEYLIPSLFLKTMIDLYFRKRYDAVILCADKALENEDFMDNKIVFEIRYLLCLALAKQKDRRFTHEVHKIKEPDYSFLYGFYYRQIGAFDQALENIDRCLERQPNFSKAKREKVQIYIGLQEFQEAKNLAEENYKTYRDNPYHIQAYFTCLIKSEKSEGNRRTLEILIASLAELSSNIAKEMMFRCKAQFEAFYNNSEQSALKYIEKAIELNPNIQYARIIKFDICERFHLFEEMEMIIDFFKKSENKARYQHNIVCFEAVLMAAKGEVSNAICFYENNIRNFTPEAKEKFILKLKKYSEGT
jgi:hypothetical protein